MEGILAEVVVHLILVAEVVLRYTLIQIYDLPFERCIVNFFVDLGDVDCVLLILMSFERLLLCLDVHCGLRNVDGIFIFLGQLVQVYLDLLG